MSSSVSSEAVAPVVAAAPAEVKQEQEHKGVHKAVVDAYFDALIAQINRCSAQDSDASRDSLRISHFRQLLQLDFFQNCDRRTPALMELGETIARKLVSTHVHWRNVEDGPLVLFPARKQTGPRKPKVLVDVTEGGPSVIVTGVLFFDVKETLLQHASTAVPLTLGSIFWTDLVVLVANPVLRRTLCWVIMDSLGALCKAHHVAESEWGVPLLACLADLLAVPAVAREFCIHPDFVPSILQGRDVERSTLLAHFLQVAGASRGRAQFFPNATSIVDIERIYLFKQVRSSLNVAQFFLCQAFRRLIHTDGFTRSALLTFIATLAHSNWGRVRQAVSATASSDTLLLTAGTTMLKICHELKSLDSVEGVRQLSPFYLLHDSRVNILGETMFNQTQAGLMAWREDNKALLSAIAAYETKPGPVLESKVPDNSSSNRMDTDSDDEVKFPDLSTLTLEEQREYFTESMHPAHRGMACDHCRVNEPKGIRYKCANCVDFDLCEACESKMYVDMRHIVKFKCPIQFCYTENLSESELRAHFIQHHTTYPGSVQCPVCISNGVDMQMVRRVPMKYLLIHLAQNHCDTHDTHTHLLLRMPHLLPFTSFGVKFEPLPLYHMLPRADWVEPIMPERKHVQVPVVAESTIDAEPVPPSSSDGKKSLITYEPVIDDDINPSVEMNEDVILRRNLTIRAHVQAIQDAIVHTNVACAHCHVPSISGIRYRCLTCPTYNLCGKCIEGQYDHDPVHVFLQVRRPLLPTTDEEGVLQPEQADSRQLYPSCILGAGGAYNFQTEWFFHTSRMLNLGLLRTYLKINIVKQNPRLAAGNDKKSLMLAREATANNPDTLHEALWFYSKQAQWLLELMQSETQKELIASLPLYLATDIALLLSYMSQRAPTILNSYLAKDAELQGMRLMFRLLVLVFNSDLYTNNHHERAKILSTLSYYLVDTAYSDDLANANTAPVVKFPKVRRILIEDDVIVPLLSAGMMRLYLNAQKHAVSQTRWFDKVNVVHRISNAMPPLFRAEASHLHTACVNALAQSDRKLCLRFLNGVLDHITFVIEFSHGRLELIQQQLDTDPQYTEGPYWASHEHTFATLPAFEKSAVEFLHLCTTSSGLFGLSQLLLRPEIVTRVAQVLNFCLDRFIGRKYQAIEQTAQALMLDRSQLARVVGRTYLYLLPAQFPKECGSVPHSLVEAMCADPSQFELEWFSEKLAMLPDTNPDSVTLYAQFVNDLKTGIDQLHAMDDLLGEIPEEFECTLMGTLMIDPVILPTSNITVDRASIERHLISSETDPFNRQFLSISMLKPNAELKQRLQDWKKAKQAQPRPLPTPVVEQAVVAEAQVPPAVNNSNAVLESKQEDASMDTE